MKRFTFHKLHINESPINVPSEGIFWVINNEFVAFDTPVNIFGFGFANVEHIKLWPEIMNRYKVNGKTVSYDYYPRGRVMVNSIKDENELLLRYDAYIYIDNCINNKDILDDIKYTFRLNKPNCTIVYVGADGGITSNHYTCHNCFNNN